jgi:formamidopyrimidine-DNA glycosylase
MPELPDVELYLHALRPRVLGKVLQTIRIRSPFLLQSVEVAPRELHGRRLQRLQRLGKRIVLGFDDDLFAILHLMIAGRLQWKSKGIKVPGKVGLGAFDFESGTLLLTEASSHKRAHLHLVRGEAAVARHDPGGLEVLTASLDAFTAALCQENHTLKRSLTDPRLFSGIGNAYSDEILHRARLSPVKLTRRLTAEEIEALHRATQTVLVEWAERLREQAKDEWPTKVTAFHPEMAVHGRHGRPCPDCGAPVQRITYRSNETNYCAVCQNGGRLLADRSLSRLLKKDWPKRLDELEKLTGGSQ